VARILKPVLVLALTWLLCPGLTEVTENLWHVATTGHHAHALEAGDDHAPEGDEHGCSGTFHVCTCCHSAPAQAAALLAARPGAAPPEAPTVLASVTRLPPDLPGVDHPPRA
jgi:hypothetical protein